MSTARLNQLPFDQLDASQFESFVLHFLGAGIRLDVIERPPLGQGEEPGSPTASGVTVRRCIVRVTGVGTSGQNQHGIDVIAYTETGAQCVFQCKHWPKKKFDEAAAKAVVEKANTEYPEASRYFVVLTHPPTNPIEVRRLIEADSKWELWEPSELSLRFLDDEVLGRDKQIEIIRRFFPALADQLIAQFFPQQDALLISAADFFSRDWPINFDTDLVGREAELRRLLEFAELPGPAATILSAPGGIGKTRLLRAFAEALAAQSPDIRVLFLNPDANPQANTDALRAATTGKLVVVFDDAHRSEVLRKDVARTVSEKQGHLLLSARPQAIEALRTWLADHGFSTARNTEPISIRALSPAQLTKLAAATLGEAHRRHAGTLARLAQGNALIVTLAAKLLNAQPPQAVDTLLASADFGRQVMERLAEKTLETFEESRREQARGALHVLAVLAPWTEEVLPLDRIAAVLGCSIPVFRRLRDELLRSRLVVRTGRGLRVVPDLLADHLVRSACFEPGSGNRPTALAESIQREFSPAISCTTGLHVIRNLAEAEAQQGDADGALVGPFWERLQRQFREVAPRQRARLVHEWASFAVHQPVRSLALARLAIETARDLGDAVESAESVADANSPLARWRVATTAELLEPVAAHCAGQRREAFDLLWLLDRDTADQVAPSSSSALDALGHIADWKNHGRLDAVRDLLAWLTGCLRSADGAARLLHRRSPALSVLLKPVFECAYDWVEADPISAEARLLTLPARDTGPLHAVALGLIEREVLPAGELAVLNIHAVLAVAISQATHGMPEAVRFRVLRLIEQGLAGFPSPRVVFRLREILRQVVAREPAGAFRDAVQAALQSISDGSELRLATVLLSNRWNEFVDCLPWDQREDALKDEVSGQRWGQLVGAVTGDLLASVASGSQLLSQVTQVAGEYAAAGEIPNFPDLFGMIVRQAPSLAGEFLERALEQPQTAFDGSLLHLVDPRAPVLPVETIAARVFGASNSVRWVAMLSWLGWLDREALVPSLLEKIGRWAERLDDDGLLAVLSALNFWQPSSAEISRTILDHLPLGRLADSSIGAICQRLGSQCYDPERFDLPPAFRRALIAELHRLDDFGIRHQQSCLPWLAQREPRAFFLMLERRIGEAASRDRCFPLGLDEFVPLGGLCAEPDYSELAKALLAKVRSSDRKSRRHWAILFQWAVLSVSPLGLTLLGDWLDDTREAEDLERLIRCLRFPQKPLVIEHPEFVRRILARAREVAPLQFEALRATLAETGSPVSSSFTAGEPDPKSRRYRDEAAKAAAIHAADPELAAFYRLIVGRADAWFAAAQRGLAEPEDEWSY